METGTKSKNISPNSSKAQPKMTPKPWLSFHNRITTYFNCKRCLEEKPVNLAASQYRSIDVGMTPRGLQVWCSRHNVNIAHIDFEQAHHPINTVSGMPGRGGTAIVVESDGGFWVSMRNNCGACNNVYGCPGGSLEGDEDWMDGACRELLEETGLLRSELQFLDVTAHQGVKTDWTAWFWTVLQSGEELKNLEPEKHGEWTWFKFEDAGTIPLFLTTKYVIDCILAGRK